MDRALSEGILLRRQLVGMLFILLSFSIVTVSAFVYQQATQTVTQNIVEVATINLKNSDLGDIDEGDTKTYTKNEVSNLGDAISITTTKSGVYLHLNSDLDDLDTYYNTYNIVVKFDTVPAGSGHSSGDTACTLTLSSPDYSSINLDVSGTWTFDFEITTNPKSVDSDTETTVTIVVLAESSS